MGEAENFLYSEAKLTYTYQLEQWHKLFIIDEICWMPCDEHDNANYETPIIHDDILQLEKLIYQLRKKHLAQDRRLHTIHFISNVQVEPICRLDEVTVWCNQLIHEIRPDDHQQLQLGLAEPRSFAARCKYPLRQNTGNRLPPVVTNSNKQNLDCMEKEVQHVL